MMNGEIVTALLIPHSAFRNLHYFLTAPNATRYNGAYG